MQKQQVIIHFDDFSVLLDFYIASVIFSHNDCLHGVWHVCTHWPWSCIRSRRPTYFRFRNSRLWQRWASVFTLLRIPLQLVRLWRNHGLSLTSLNCCHFVATNYVTWSILTLALQTYGRAAYVSFRVASGSRSKFVQASCALSVQDDNNKRNESQ